MARSGKKADRASPRLPAALPDGNFPAVAFTRASIAREIVARRRKAGLSQAELARRAGIRPETLNRIERAHTAPRVSIVEKIAKALEVAEHAR